MTGWCRDNSGASCKQRRTPVGRGQRGTESAEGTDEEWGRQIYRGKVFMPAAPSFKATRRRSENTEEQCSQSALYLTIGVSVVLLKIMCIQTPWRPKPRPGSCRSRWGLRVWVYYRQLLPQPAQLDSTAGWPIPGKGENKNCVYKLDGKLSLVHFSRWGPCDVQRSTEPLF